MILWHLFISFFKVGTFAFGGGLAMLPIIFQEVAKYGMMTQTEFGRLVALSQVTPGPVAVNAATYTGMVYAGVPGAVVATLGVAIPSFLVMIIVMMFMEAFKGSNGLEAIFSGIRPATAGMIAAAFIYLAQTSIIDVKLFSKAFIEGFPQNVNLFALCVFVATIVMAGKFKMNPIYIILMMGAVGAVLCNLIV